MKNVKRILKLIEKAVLISKVISGDKEGGRRESKGN